MYSAKFSCILYFLLLFFPTHFNKQKRVLWLFLLLRPDRTGSQQSNSVLTDDSTFKECICARKFQALPFKNSSLFYGPCTLAN